MGASDGNFRCFSCGRWTKDVTEGGPDPDDEHVAQSHRWTTAVLRVDGRAAVACWICFWKTEPDMWISEENWDALNPIIPAAKLPQLLDSDLVTFKHEDPASYPWKEEWCPT